MNMTYGRPPILTGSAETDTAALSEWCSGLLSQLKALLQSIDGSNMVSVSGGKIDLSAGGIKGGHVELTDNGLTVTDGSSVIFRADKDGVTISAPDGSRYIRYGGGTLDIKADNITCGSITANTYKNLPQ